MVDLYIPYAFIVVIVSDGDDDDCNGDAIGFDIISHAHQSWSEVTELIEEKLLTRQEVEAMWEGLPKTEGGIDLGGFWTFDRQVNTHTRHRPL